MVSGAAGSREVIARNFPAAWVAPAALGSLPSKVQSLLQRIGNLEGAPVVRHGSAGLEALASFQTPQAARDAVQTLHGTDLRTAAEKRAENFAAPKESVRFWLALSSGEASAAGAPAAAPAAAPQQRPSGATPQRASGPPSRRTGWAAGGSTGGRGGVSRVVYLSPLPSTWGRGDVTLLTQPYGNVKDVRMHDGEGHRGAFISFGAAETAQQARASLDGLSLMGTQLRCIMQEAPEQKRPTVKVVVYIDELHMPSRPNVEPRLDDRELFLTELPRAARSEEAACQWLAGFADVADVLLLKDLAGKATGSAYARFRTHLDARKALDAIKGAAVDGAQQADWSESERVQRGTRGPYGLDVLRRLGGDGGARFQDICRASGSQSLTLAAGGGAARTHFALSSETPAQVEECKRQLSGDLAKLHEAYAREVKGSLVLRGFPASWSEKGLRFIFAPFGGLASVSLEEERPAGAGADAAATRLAYVKLRNEAAMEKAVTNLHQTRVGDGDLVEECVVECHRWHPRGWSDGSFFSSVFIDQLPMSRRPAETQASPEDVELFVQNLPLQDMNRQQLVEYFEGFGEVDHLLLIRDHFTGEPSGEGYVRFKSHRDAQRCIEALTPSEADEADPMDLTGSWSESERAQQRKLNCYRFNIVAELVGPEGSGRDRLKKEAKLKSLWLLAESLTQKDKWAPTPDGRQLQFAARCPDEASARAFRELLVQALEDAHARISDRIEKRKRKALEAAAAPPPKQALLPSPPHTAPAGGGAHAATDAPSGQSPWHASPAGGWPAANYWGGWPQPPTGTAPGAALPPGYFGYPGAGAQPGGAPGYPAPAGAPTGAAWGAPPAQMPPGPAGPSVFEQRPSAVAPQDKERQDDDEKRHSRSRRRKRRHRRREGDDAGEDGDKDGAEKEKRHRSSSRKRRRRRGEDRSGSAQGD